MAQVVENCMIGVAMAEPTPSDPVFALAFETSGAWGSVALGYGDRIIATRPFSGPRRHAVEFLPTVELLCRTNSVDAAAVRRIYVSSGPGSFTGLRIGITAARTMALATGASIVAVPTLEVIAQNAALCKPQAPVRAVSPSRTELAAHPPDRVAVILDAKRKRVYAATFQRRGGVYVATSEPAEVEPAPFLSTLDPGCAVMGEGITYHREAVEASGLITLPDALSTPRAESVYRLGVARACKGRFVDARSLIPLYVRPPEAEEKWKQHHSAGRTPPDVVP